MEYQIEFISPTHWKEYSDVVKNKELFPVSGTLS